MDRCWLRWWVTCHDHVNVDTSKSTSTSATVDDQNDDPRYRIHRRRRLCRSTLHHCHDQTPSWWVLNHHQFSRRGVIKLTGIVNPQRPVDYLAVRQECSRTNSKAAIAIGGMEGSRQWLSQCYHEPLYWSFVLMWNGNRRSKNRRRVRSFARIGTRYYSVRSIVQTVDIIYRLYATELRLIVDWCGVHNEKHDDDVKDHSDSLVLFVNSIPSCMLVGHASCVLRIHELTMYSTENECLSNNFQITIFYQTSWRLYPIGRQSTTRWYASVAVTCDIMSRGKQIPRVCLQQ